MGSCVSTTTVRKGSLEPPPPITVLEFVESDFPPSPELKARLGERRGFGGMPTLDLSGGNNGGDSLPVSNFPSQRVSASSASSRSNEKDEYLNSGFRTPAPDMSSLESLANKSEQGACIQRLWNDIEADLEGHFTSLERRNMQDDIGRASVHCKEIGLEKDKLQLKKEMLLRQGKYREAEGIMTSVLKLDIRLLEFQMLREKEKAILEEAVKLETLVLKQCRQAIGDGAVREVIEWEEVAEMVLNWPRLNDLKRALGHPVHKYIKGGKVVKVS